MYQLEKIRITAPVLDGTTSIYHRVDVTICSSPCTVSLFHGMVRWIFVHWSREELTSVAKVAINGFELEALKKAFMYYTHGEYEMCNELTALIRMAAFCKQHKGNCEGFQLL